jgi:hypothetical protein
MLRAHNLSLHKAQMTKVQTSQHQQYSQFTRKFSHEQSFSKHFMKDQNIIPYFSA